MNEEAEARSEKTTETDKEKTGAGAQRSHCDQCMRMSEKFKKLRHSRHRDYAGAAPGFGRAAAEKAATKKKLKARRRVPP